MTGPYAGREQTKAKHFILKHYLEALAFKVLTFSDITYVDGFSGPWETKTEDFSDSSFMIAISVLQDAQNQILKRTGKQRRIRCFFSESNPEAFARLEPAVAPYNKPEERFEIKTYGGKFEDAINEIQSFIGMSFALIFIDPTGWKGFSFDKIKPLFARPKCEVQINFMYDFVRRFADSGDESTIASFDPIFGGPGWRDRLDPNVSRGLALEKLFRDTLKSAGNFDFVISAEIDKPIADRPHFFIVFGTKSLDGLKEFRKIEFDALREHAKNRARAKERKREERTNTVDLFAGYHAEVQESTIDELVQEQKVLAVTELKATLSQIAPCRFSAVVAKVLQTYMLRETDVKNICVELAKVGIIENTWGTGNRKPKDDSIIRLIVNVG